MTKIRYQFNPKTLNYEKVRPAFKDYLSLGLKYFFIALFISTGSILVYNSIFENPKVVAQERELKMLKQEMALLNADIDTLSHFAQDLRFKDDEIYRNIFGADQYPSHLRNPGIGGVDRFQYLRNYDYSDDLIETKKRVARLQRQLVAQSKSLEEVFSLAAQKTDMLSSIPAIQPVHNKDLKRMASGYGWRIHPILKIKKKHTGMDFSAPIGTEIYATGDGEVILVDKPRIGYGWHVIIKHGFGYQTLYGHMSEILVRQGQKVNRGEVIGLVGNTGTSVGPHLHYEVIKNGDKVNPAHYYFNDLSPDQYEELLEKSQQANQSFD